MKSNTILWIFLAIILIAAIMYLVAFLIRRKNEERLDDLEKRKSDLFDLPVVDEVEEIKKMHLIGQSQNTFREWNQKWTDISTTSFAALETRIFEAENLNETLRFMQVKQAVNDAFETMDEMEKEVEEVRAGLKELRETEERNSVEVQEALDKYEVIKKVSKEEPEKFGPTLSEINKQIDEIEAEFKEFVNLNSSGDPVEAGDVLKQAENHTYELEATMESIPPLVEELEEEFPSQLEELQEAYQKLLDQNYKFVSDDFEKEFEKVKTKIDLNVKTLGRFELSDAREENEKIASRIDGLYSQLEKEIEAKQFVHEKLPVVEAYIQHVLENNHKLVIELDHVSQSYELNKNELGITRGSQTQLEDLQKSFESLKENVEAEEVIYSQVQARLENDFEMLDEIENQQIEITEACDALREGEKVAQTKIDEFEFDLRTLKRYVDKQRLPGIPQNYFDFFYVATDRIEELSHELNKIRIDMDRINQLVDFCEQDLEVLHNKTEELIDSAALTEEMLQYANRYRMSHEEIAVAGEKSYRLFVQDYNYHDALDEIGVALEKVEPGAFKRIEAAYFKTKNQDITF